MPDLLYAVVSDGVMVAVASDVPLEIPDGHEYVDITNASPQPMPGWSYDGTTWTQPEPMANSATMHDSLEGAIPTNQAFYSHIPSQAQITQQLMALAKQINQLIRLVGGHLDDTT